MDKNEKFIWSGFAVLVVCVLIGYFAAPFNPNFATLMVCIGFIALGASLGAMYADSNVCTTEQPCKAPYEDDCREQNRIEMFEIVSTDVETSKLCYVDKACDALEKIASASGDGTFDKQDIMRAAVDFRERADVIRRHAAILIEARRNGHVDGVKELIDSYTAEPLFAGFDDAVMNYLPESFHNPNYLNVDEAVYGNYKVLKGLC